MLSGTTWVWCVVVSGREPWVLSGPDLSSEMLMAGYRVADAHHGRRTAVFDEDDRGRLAVLPPRQGGAFKEGLVLAMDVVVNARLLRAVSRIAPVALGAGDPPLLA